MSKKNKLVFGVGINDADYAINPRAKGKRVMCPFYQAWQSMVRRCYSEKYQDKHPTYIGCSVCSQWLTFSNFKSWMEKQDWVDKELDKDIIIEGNKLYSPETCVFVSAMTNTFIIDGGAKRGEWPLGVAFHKRDKKFRAQCRNPFTNKYEYLGNFTCPNEAHLAWRSRKHELACHLAELQSDERVATSMRCRYALDKSYMKS